MTPQSDLVSRTLAIFSEVYGAPISWVVRGGQSKIEGTCLQMSTTSDLYTEMERLAPYLLFRSNRMLIQNLGLAGKEVLKSILPASCGGLFWPSYLAWMLEGIRISRIWEEIYPGSVARIKAERCRGALLQHFDFFSQLEQAWLQGKTENPAISYVLTYPKLGPSSTAVLFKHVFKHLLNIHYGFGDLLAPYEYYLVFGSGVTATARTLLDTQDQTVPSPQNEEREEQEIRSIQRDIQAASRKNAEVISAAVCITHGSFTSEIQLSDTKLQAALQYQVMLRQIRSRRKSALCDSGLDVDIEAIVRNQVGNTDSDVFRTPTTAKGFNILLLVDRSSSMESLSSNTLAEEVRVLQLALSLPDIVLQIVGFTQSSHKADLCLYTYEGEFGKLPAGEGRTPIAEAIQWGVNQLYRKPGANVLAVLTDGEPCSINFNDAQGRFLPMPKVSEAFDRVHSEVQRARAHRITTLGMIIPNPSSKHQDSLPKYMRDMFGSGFMGTTDQLVRTLVEVVK